MRKPDSSGEGAVASGELTPKSFCDHADVLLTLFLWSFLAATILPVGSEPALVAILMRDREPFVPVLVATAGNYLGACLTYYMARIAVATLQKEKERAASVDGPDHQERAGNVRSPSGGRTEAKALEMMRRYGAPALLLSWVPFLGDAIVIAAGAVKIRFDHFSLWTIVGKGARYAVVAYITLAASK